MFFAGILAARRSTVRTPSAGGPTSDTERPRLAAVFADAEYDAAAMRAAKAQADIVKAPQVAALLIVDHQSPVFQADLIEILPVEPCQAKAVEPVQPRQQSADVVTVIGDSQARRRFGVRATAASLESMA